MLAEKFARAADTFKDSNTKGYDAKLNFEPLVVQTFFPSLAYLAPVCELFLLMTVVI